WGDDGRDPAKVENALVPRFGGRNTIQTTEPGGRYGSVGARLMKILRAGHEGVELTNDELRKFSDWIDLNAVFYGVYELDEQQRQLRGEIVAAPKIQ
ncbi:MAG: hypothetical protein HUK22_03220, partial [Thermoguttaceae bacterium]|nr:hypothetical protein [Thermoguttaceae bacterium]